MTTTKFSRRLRWQATPWPCKRSPPCLPPPPPIDETSTLHMTLRWWHPESPWPPLPQVNYYDTFELHDVPPITQHWTGSDLIAGIVGPYGFIRWLPFERLYEWRFTYRRAPGAQILTAAFKFAMPTQPPFTAGPYEHTDASEQSEITFFIRA